MPVAAVPGNRKKKDLKARYPPSVIAGRLPFCYRPRGMKEIR